MNLLPNLIIVGVAKSGTTSLFHQLKENPEIFIPEIKECRFFSQMSRDYKGGEAAKFQNEGPRDIKSYIKLFIFASLMILNAVLKQLSIYLFDFDEIFSKALFVL